MIPPSTIELLCEPVLFIERQKDVASLSVGWKSAKKMRIYRWDSTQIGFIYEEFSGNNTIAARNFTRRYRSFKFSVYNNYNQHVLTILRPPKVITSTVQCYTPDGSLIGEAHQQWHPWRRKYLIYNSACVTPLNMFPMGPFTSSESVQSSRDEIYSSSEEITRSRLSNDRNDAQRDADPKNENVFDKSSGVDSSQFVEFAQVNTKSLSHNLSVMEKASRSPIAAITFDWSGVGSEFFNRHGLYAVDLEPQDSDNKLNVCQRAALLGTAMSIDTDFFSNAGGDLAQQMQYFKRDL